MVLGPNWFSLWECAMALKARIYGDHNGDEISLSNGLECKDPSRTVQSQKDEADINTIVRNFGVTGKVPENVRIPEYGDFTSVGDYRDCIEAIRAADESFMKMPSDFRARLDNDPQKFLEYCANPDNLPEMRKLGFAVPLPAEPVPVAPATS